jgi:hypothetical protein
MHAATDIFSRKAFSSRYTYSKEDRASVCKIEGSRANSAVKISASSTARYLVLQVRRRAVEDFTFTITLRDDRGNRFNFAFSTVTRKSDRQTSSQTSALVQLEIPRNVWVTVVFDLQQVAEQFWRTGAFHQLDGIEISPVCTVARIFAQDCPPTYDGFRRLALPKLFAFPAGIESETVQIPALSAVPEPDTQSKIEPSKPPMTAESRGSRKSGAFFKPRANEKRGTTAAPSCHSVVIPASAAPSCHSVVIPAKAKPAAVAVAKTAPKDDDDISDDGAFDGVAPSGNLTQLDVFQNSAGNEENELELVRIESLGCYYCPGNQQYYQLDDQ